MTLKCSASQYAKRLNVLGLVKYNTRNCPVQTQAHDGAFTGLHIADTLASEKNHLEKRIERDEELSCLSGGPAEILCAGSSDVSLSMEQSITSSYVPVSHIQPWDHPERILDPSIESKVSSDDSSHSSTKSEHTSNESATTTRGDGSDPTLPTQPDSVDLSFEDHGSLRQHDSTRSLDFEAYTSKSRFLYLWPQLSTAADIHVLSPIQEQIAIVANILCAAGAYADAFDLYHAVLTIQRKYCIESVTVEWNSTLDQQFTLAALQCARTASNSSQLRCVIACLLEVHEMHGRKSLRDSYIAGVVQMFLGELSAQFAESTEPRIWFRFSSLYVSRAYELCSIEDQCDLNLARKKFRMLFPERDDLLLSCEYLWCCMVRHKTRSNGHVFVRSEAVDIECFGGVGGHSDFCHRYRAQGACIIAECTLNWAESRVVDLCSPSWDTIISFIASKSQALDAFGEILSKNASDSDEILIHVLFCYLVDHYLAKAHSRLETGSLRFKSVSLKSLLAYTEEETHLESSGSRLTLLEFVANVSLTTVIGLQPFLAILYSKMRRLRSLGTASMLTEFIKQMQKMQKMYPVQTPR